MINKLLFIPIILMFLTATSCQKNLAGSLITISGYTNDTIHKFYYHTTNKSKHYCPPFGDPAIGSPKEITHTGNGNYLMDLDEDESNRFCISITGKIPANGDSTGKTIVNIEAFYTKEGNVVGFKNIELKRPHGELEIFYQFRPDTYIE